DDIVFADLNPSEDYKSSVLSGLRPDIIMEICSRALSFWTYQTTQEACFQEMMYKSLEDKYTQLEKQVQGLMRDAQSEVTTLQKDMELEKRKTHDLAEQLQEKGRQFSKLQLMYDKLKRRSLVPAIQQTVNNTTGIGPIGVGSRQSSAYPSSIQRSHTWNGSNSQGENNIHRAQQLPISQQDYSAIREQSPFSTITNSGKRMTDGNEMNPNFQQKSPFTQTRTPFAMVSNSGVKMSTQNRGGIR
ncbi:7135_t:CDS:2, partial [Dentiscutata heterogama]